MTGEPTAPTAPTQGRYRNPVLHADWSDPDVIRVGDDYYMTASSFTRVPGLPLLHSRDLVNWRLVGHALPRLEPEAEFTAPCPEGGVWAPALRHHAGRFWIFWGDPDRGILQVNAPHIGGPWSPPLLLKPGKGLIDPCPLWDEDGNAYLVHAWAKSRSGVKNRLTGHRMTPEARELLDAGRTLIDGDALPGWFTLEGPKLYRREGHFWIFAPAGGVETGWQGAFRAREFTGPYEERVVLEQGRTDVNGPHQGAWVDTPHGEHYFLHFQHRGAHGRVTHLQPLRWGDDGWPVLGDEGEPVASHDTPKGTGEVTEHPATDDDFPGGRFGLQWTWTANPRPGWTVPHEGDGLRLSCVRTDPAHDLRTLPHVLVQRLPGGPGVRTAQVALRFGEGAGEGATAGLAVLGGAFSWIGLERAPGGAVRLVHRFAEPSGAPERDAARPREAPEGRALLRVEIGPHARCRFFADLGDGAGFRPSGQVFAATAWGWMGAQLGLFATAPHTTAPYGGGPAGTAEFTAFRVLSDADADAGTDTVDHEPDDYLRDTGGRHPRPGAESED